MDKESADRETNKIRILLSVCDLFTPIYMTSNVACFDETIVPFQGRSKFLVYMPQKPDKGGLKIYALCDSTKMIPVVKEDMGNNEDMILNMVKSFPHKISYVFMDSFLINQVGRGIKEAEH